MDRKSLRGTYPRATSWFRAWNFVGEMQEAWVHRYIISDGNAAGMHEYQGVASTRVLKWKTASLAVHHRWSQLQCVTVSKLAFRVELWQ
jgi:hypothetical protein